MKIIKYTWSLLSDLGRAKYAASLARNGQYKRAQALYRD